MYPSINVFRCKSRLAFINLIVYYVLLEGNKKYFHVSSANMLMFEVKQYLDTNRKNNLELDLAL